MDVNFDDKDEPVVQEELYAESPAEDDDENNDDVLFEVNKSRTLPQPLYEPAYETLPTGETVPIVNGKMRVVDYNGHCRQIIDIKVGDILMGPDSKPRTVTAIRNSYDDMYSISTQKYATYILGASQGICVKVSKHATVCYDKQVRAFRVEYFLGDARRREFFAVKAYGGMKEAEDKANQRKHELQKIYDIFDVPIGEYIQKSASWKYIQKLCHVAIEFPESASASVPLVPITAFLKPSNTAKLSVRLNLPPPPPRIAERYPPAPVTPISKLPTFPPILRQRLSVPVIPISKLPPPPPVPASGFVKQNPLRKDKPILGFNLPPPLVLPPRDDSGLLNAFAYLLGLWIGDGTSAASSIANIDQEVIDFLYRIAPKIETQVTHNNNGIVYYMKGIQTYVNPFRRFLRANNLLYNKHVPHAYRTASRQVRLHFLAGFIDTDGSLGGGSFVINQKSNANTEGAVFIARSLGLSVNLRAFAVKLPNPADDGSDRFTLRNRIQITGHTNQIPTLIKRKQAQKRRHKRDVSTVRIAVEQLPKAYYRIIEVDGDGFIVLDNFVPVKCYRLDETPTAQQILTQCTGITDEGMQCTKRCFGDRCGQHRRT